MRTSRWTCALLLPLALARPVSSQRPISYERVYGSPVTYLLANALMGGLSAGLHAVVTGHDPARAVEWGAAGGAVSYLGILTTTRNVGGTPVPGLLLTAAGGSIGRNAADGRPPFSRWILPLGPLYLELDTRPSLRPGVRLSARRLLGFVCFLADDYYRLDPGESIARLTPVFAAGGVTAGHENALCSGLRGHSGAALARYGSIAATSEVLRGGQSGARIWPHEMGHVAQSIRDDLLLNHGAARELSSALGVEGWLVIDMVTPLRWLSNGLQRLGPEDEQWQNSWYEREVEASRGRNLCLDPVTPCYW